LNNLRISTFNLESLEDKPGAKPTLSERITLMKTSSFGSRPINSACRR